MINSCGSSRPVKSLPLWGAWIETPPWAEPGAPPSPSLPLWGAWIETMRRGRAGRGRGRRSPYGERGLKLKDRCGIGHNSRRSPYGERGLKPVLGQAAARSLLVAPPMGSVD